MASLQRVSVPAASRRYDVAVGPGALAEVGPCVRGRRRVAVVSQTAIAAVYAEPVVKSLDAAGVDSEMFFMDDGEQAKTLATVERLAGAMSAWGLLRADVIVALGGGVVGDTVGFTAACYHRGVDVVQAPTTLLAQVDAAIGGKTGVNLPEGKNLVGAFHQPIAVLADVSTLATLPAREYRSGLGEVAKYALMGGDGSDKIAALVEDRSDALLARDPSVLTELVAACAAIKAAVVVADETEQTGLRATLNYGHTFAHALETAGRYELMHGEAVAIGLVFAAELARALERIPPDAVERHAAIVAALGLPAAVPVELSADELLDIMVRDKKARGGLTFVLPGAAGLELVDDPPEIALAHAFRAVGVKVGE
jgi:5-deoxy-5-amino-3-dehydroquinate synthase